MANIEETVSKVSTLISNESSNIADSFSRCETEAKHLANEDSLVRQLVSSHKQRAKSVRAVNQNIIELEHTLKEDEANAKINMMKWQSERPGDWSVHTKERAHDILRPRVLDWLVICLIAVEGLTCLDKTGPG